MNFNWKTSENSEAKWGLAENGEGRLKGFGRNKQNILGPWVTSEVGVGRGGAGSGSHYVPMA